MICITASSLIKNNCNQDNYSLRDIFTIYQNLIEHRGLFSDAAAAVIVEYSQTNSIGPFVFKTAGDGGKFLMVDENKKFYMDGPAVLKFSLSLVPDATYELISKSNYKIEYINTFIFHQASAVVLNKLKKKLNISDDKWFNRIENIGNTASATIPIAINMLQNENNFNYNNKYLLMDLSWFINMTPAILKSVFRNPTKPQFYQ